MWGKSKGSGNATLGAIATIMGVLVVVFSAYFFLENRHAERDHVHTSVNVPTGAVVAFDLTTGCPEGWDGFKEANGRFLLGQSDERPEWEYRQQSGEAEHVLTIDEMPQHTHQYFDNSYAIVNPISRSGDGGHEDQTRTTASTGGSMAHNNMPPYVSIFWCKKL